MVLIMFPSPLHFLLAGALLLGACAVTADEVTDQLDAARSAYDSGDLRIAQEALRFADAKIQEKLRARQMELLPAPLEGWTAEDGPASDAAGFAALVGGTTIARTYSRSDGAEVQVQLMADSPLMSMMTMVMSNPFLIQADPGTSLYTHGRFRGMLKQDPDDGGIELSLTIGSRILLQISGDRGATKADVEAYLNAMDLASLEKSLLQ